MLNQTFFMLLCEKMVVGFTYFVGRNSIKQNISNSVSLIIVAFLASKNQGLVRLQAIVFSSKA